MKKRLGTIPKGLEWIADSQELTQEPIKQEVQQHLLPAQYRKNVYN